MLPQEAVRVVSASPSIPNQREALLTGVKEAVETDPNSLHTFANVLCTISTNVSLGQAILDDISEYDNISLDYVKLRILLILSYTDDNFLFIIMCLGKYFPTPEVGVVPETIKDHDVFPQGNNY